MRRAPAARCTPISAASISTPAVATPAGDRRRLEHLMVNSLLALDNVTCDFTVGDMTQGLLPAFEGELPPIAALTSAPRRTPPTDCNGNSILDVVDIVKRDIPRPEKLDETCPTSVRVLRCRSCRLACWRSWSCFLP